MEIVSIMLVGYVLGWLVTGAAKEINQSLKK